MNEAPEHTESIDRYMDNLIAAAKHGTYVEVLNARADLGAFMLRHTAKDAPSLAAKAPISDEMPKLEGSYLPPIGTPEEVLARILASLLFRTALMFHDGQDFPSLFSLKWQGAQLEALRAAFPVLGALEDARLEEPV
jgi:hypothetical protein